jgi:hypothetical protein
MSRALLEEAPSVSAGVKVTHTFFEADRLAKKAHNGQPKVNALEQVGRKKGFFRPFFESFPKTACFKEDEWRQPQTRTRRIRQA